MAVSSLPVCCSVARKPSAIASSAIRTPTTPAMPMITTEDDPIRCGMVVTARAVADQAWRPVRVSASHAKRSATATRIPQAGRSTSAVTGTTAARINTRTYPIFRNIRSPSASRKGIHDPQPHAAPRWQRTDQKPDERHEAQALQPALEPHRQHRDRAEPRADDAHRKVREAESRRSSEREQQHRLGEHQREHAAVREADGLRIASSGMRSRTACAMVLPVSSTRVKNTAPMMEPTMRPMSANWLTKEAWKESSLCVLVSWSELAEIASIAWAIWSASFGCPIFSMYQPTWPPPNSAASSKYFQ